MVIAATFSPDAPEKKALPPESRQRCTLMATLCPAKQTGPDGNSHPWKAPSKFYSGRRLHISWICVWAYGKCRCARQTGRAIKTEQLKTVAAQKWLMNDAGLAGSTPGALIRDLGSMAAERNRSRSRADRRLIGDDWGEWWSFECIDRDRAGSIRWGSIVPLK